MGESHDFPAVGTPLDGEPGNAAGPLDGSGLLPANQLPPAALTAKVLVADQAARYALTSAQVQEGDLVRQTDTGRLYAVVDVGELNNSAGYQDLDEASMAALQTHAAGSGVHAIAGVTGLQAALDGKLDLYTSPMYLANSALTGGRIIANDVDATRVVSVDLTYSGAQAFATLTAEDAGGIYSEVSAGTDGVTNYHEDGGGKFAGIYLSSAYPEGRVTVETDGEIHLVTGVDDRITVNNDGTVTLHATTAASLAAALGAGAPTGTVAMWGTGSAPTGWLLADGSAVSRTTYSALFAIIGTTFGAGDGSTTFGLPDFRGRAPIGAGTGSGLTARTLAGTVGAETHTLTAAESGLPSHTHTIGGADTPNYAYGTNPIKGTGSGASTDTGSTGGTSASSAHNNMQPSLVVNFIIKT